MGFSDQEIVALSGAHNLGVSCLACSEYLLGAEVIAAVSC